MLRGRRFFCAVIAWLVAQSVSMPQTPGATRVVKVERAVESSSASSSARNLAGTRLTKFVHESIESAGKETYVVTWAPPRGGLNAGTVVQFEYRQRNRPGVRKLRIEYPFPVNELRRATFTVSGDALRKGGPITAWRARVISGGRVRASRSSKKWNS